MKKIYIFILLCLSAAAAMAQDVIFTKDEELIECKIVEITETRVSYRPYDKPDSHLITIFASSIEEIIFENGETYTFENEYESNESSETSYSLQDEPDVEIPITLSSGKQVMYRSGVQLEKRNGSVYYGEYRLKHNEFVDFLKQTCPWAYNEYRKSVKCEVFGILTAITSLGVMGLSFTDLALYDGYYTEYYFGESLSARLTPTYVFAGLALMSGLLIDNNHKRNVYVIFNKYCANPHGYSTRTTLSFNVSPVGAGLCLSF